MANVETKTWAVTVTEENLNALMDAYHAACLHCIHSGFGPEGQEAVEVKEVLENALVAMGMLEGDPEPDEDEEEEANEAQSLDEWIADQRYDEYRDFDLAMGYEV